MYKDIVNCILSEIASIKVSNTKTTTNMFIDIHVNTFTDQIKNLIETIDKMDFSLYNACEVLHYTEDRSQDYQSTFSDYNFNFDNIQRNILSNVIYDNQVVILIFSKVVHDNNCPCAECHIVTSQVTSSSSNSSNTDSF